MVAEGKSELVKRLLALADSWDTQAGESTESEDSRPVWLRCAVELRCELTQSEWVMYTWATVADPETGRSWRFQVKSIRPGFLGGDYGWFPMEHCSHSDEPPANFLWPEVRGDRPMSEQIICLDKRTEILKTALWAGFGATALARLVKSWHEDSPEHVTVWSGCQSPMCALARDILSKQGEG